MHNQGVVHSRFCTNEVALKKKFLFMPMGGHRHERKMLGSCVEVELGGRGFELRGWAPCDQAKKNLKIAPQDFILVGILIFWVYKKWTWLIAQSTFTFLYILLEAFYYLDSLCKSFEAFGYIHPKVHTLIHSSWYHSWVLALSLYIYCTVFLYLWCLVTISLCL